MSQSTIYFDALSPTNALPAAQDPQLIDDGRPLNVPTESNSIVAFDHENQLQVQNRDQQKQHHQHNNMQLQHLSAAGQEMQLQHLTSSGAEMLEHLTDLDRRLTDVVDTVDFCHRWVRLSVDSWNTI